MSITSTPTPIMLIALLVGLVVCSLGGMEVVEGRPVGSDLLTGREFLEVYMRRQPNYLRHNTIPHKDEEHDNELNDISSSSLDAEELSEEDDDDEDEDEEDSASSEQPEDLLTTTSSEEMDSATTTTEGTETTVFESTRAERSTTEADFNTEEHPSQVVSVRVSSSVVRKRPETNDHRNKEDKKISVSFRVESKAVDSLTSASQTLEKFALKPNGSEFPASETLAYQRINLGSDPQNSPVNYETSVSSATSNSNIRFYQEPPKHEFRTEGGSERKQRAFHEAVFGQRQSSLYKTESSQILTETEPGFLKRDELYRTTPSRPFDKTEPAFVKTSEPFRKSQEVYDKLNGDHIYNKPQQIYTKSDDYVKNDRDFSQLSGPDEGFGTRKQFGSGQDYAEKVTLREQEFSTRGFQSSNQNLEKRQEFSQSFGHQEPEPQPSFERPQQSGYSSERAFVESGKVYGESERIYNQPEKVYVLPEKVYVEPEKTYGQPEKVYGEPEKIYGQPEKVYTQPEKVYGEPEKVYGQPEKVYGQSETVYGQHKNLYEQPEKVYGQPEKVYGQPEKVYGQPEKVFGQPEKVYGEPEQNYEVEEAVSVRTDGRTHGVQPAAGKNDKHKFGYVVEGENYRKYRVEERTSDGFIVGEYGVVSHDDGSLRGVRYTADSNINPRLIYDALVKFLSLK